VEEHKTNRERQGLHYSYTGQAEDLVQDAATCWDEEDTGCVHVHNNTAKKNRKKREAAMHNAGERLQLIALSFIALGKRD
jgi:hypothetical protein